MPNPLSVPPDLPSRLVAARPRLAGADLPPPAPQPVLVALSGGPDSTALLLWLLSHHLPLVAAHFDHRLRPESGVEASAVERFCGRLGVPIEVGRRSEPMPRGSEQAAARALRLGFLEAAARRTGARWIATGHTADDVVEGALLHLLRGAALAGLRGMPPVRGLIVRPLRHTWRADVERYLGTLGVEPLHDPTNLDVAHSARARVRHLLLPRIERSRPGLTARVRRVAERAVGWTVELETRALACAGDRARLLAEPAAVRFEAYRQLRGGLPGLARRHLEAIDRLVLGGRTGAGLDLPGGRLWVDRDTVHFVPSGEQARRPLRFEARPCAGCGCSLTDGVHLGPAVAVDRLRLGHRQIGLRLRPAGGRGTRKLQDLLVDAHVPRRERDVLPLLFSSGADRDLLVWVPGVARDRSSTVPSHVPGMHVSLT